MSVSKNMDFPFAKKAYASKVEESRSTIASALDIGAAAYVPVPGPQGPEGPQGERGLQGPPGKDGKNGKDGKDGLDGKRGKDGKDAISYIPSSGQRSGWATYVNNSNTMSKLGPDRGDDGWVPLSIKDLSRKTNEKYLPEGGSSLYGNEIQKVNLRGLNLGAQIDITYKFELTTLNSNTEIWCRSFLPGSGDSFTSFVGNLKYEYSYEFSVTHHIKITNEADRSAGLVPQVRADSNCLAIIRSIDISVR